MKRVYILVEGQTEEAFVTELLTPFYAHSGLFLTPIIVSTSPGHRGGVVTYAKVRRQIERLCRQDGNAHVTTMFDLYALPADFPGNQAGSATGNGHARATLLELALGEDIGEPNFIPNLLVHEFEALLFVDIDAFEQWTDDDDVLAPLRLIRESTAPEDINDSALTAPSKRILAAMPCYQKSFHGPLIACDIGLTAIRGACPHFANWLARIEALARPDA